MPRCWGTVLRLRLCDMPMATLLASHGMFRPIQIEAVFSSFRMKKLLSSDQIVFFKQAPRSIFFLFLRTENFFIFRHILTGGTQLFKFHMDRRREVLNSSPKRGGPSPHPARGGVPARTPQGGGVTARTLQGGVTARTLQGGGPSPHPARGGSRPVPHRGGGPSPYPAGGGVLTHTPGRGGGHSPSCKPLFEGNCSFFLLLRAEIGQAPADVAASFCF